MARTDSIDPRVVLDWMSNHFAVHPERGQLVWVVPPKNHPRLLGADAGGLRRDHRGKRYCYIKKDGRSLKRGWLIFLWVYGRWPNECIDHVDGDSANDCITNIREATVTQNSWNHKSRRKASPLPIGVRRMRDKFQARIAYNKTMLHLGVFNTPDEAHSVYLTKRMELYGEFA